MELLLNRRLFRGVTQYLVRRRGHASPADEWRRVEERVHCRDLVAEYDTTAPTRRAARNAVRPAAARPAPVPSPTAPLVAAPLTLPTAHGMAIRGASRARIRHGANRQVGPFLLA